MSRPFGALRIACAYISAVVGAGFASGQEIMRFFGAHGAAGFAGIAVSAALFFFFGYYALSLGRKLNASSYRDIVRFTNGRVLGSAIDLLLSVFLFGALAVMTAGAGAVFSEQFGVAPVWGSLSMILVCYFTVKTGTAGVVNAISAVVPLLLVSVAVSFFGSAGDRITQDELEFSKTLAGATPNWLLSSFNYAAYNIVAAMAVLAPLGANSKNEKSLLWGALLGAAGLGLCVAMIDYCVVANIKAVYRLEVPMIEITSRVSPYLRLFFSAVIFSEIYSTAAGNLYGLCRRVSFGLPKDLLAALTAAGAFAAGQLGFSNLVRYLYPAVGYAALIFFAGAVRKWAAAPNLFIAAGKNKAPEDAGAFADK